MTVKRTAGYTENQGSRPQANQQHVYFFSKVHGNIECTITEARSYLPRWARGAATCTLSQLFMVMQKLERPYKLSTGKNINQY